MTVLPVAEDTEHTLLVWLFLGLNGACYFHCSTCNLVSWHFMGSSSIGPWSPTQVASVFLRESEWNTSPPPRFSIFLNTYLLPESLPSTGIVWWDRVSGFFSFENTIFITVVGTCWFLITQYPISLPNLEESSNGWALGPYLPLQRPKESHIHFPYLRLMPELLNLTVKHKDRDCQCLSMMAAAVKVPGETGSILGWWYHGQEPASVVCKQWHKG